MFLFSFQNPIHISNPLSPFPQQKPRIERKSSEKQLPTLKIYYPPVVFLCGDGSGSSSDEMFRSHTMQSATTLNML